MEWAPSILRELLCVWFSLWTMKNTHTAYTSLLWCKSCSSKDLEPGGFLLSIWRFTWCCTTLTRSRFVCCSRSIGSTPLNAGLVIYTKCSIPCVQVSLICVVLKRGFYSHALRFLLRCWHTLVFRPHWHEVSLFLVQVLLPLHPLTQDFEIACLSVSHLFSCLCFFHGQNKLANYRFTGSWCLNYCLSFQRCSALGIVSFNNSSAYAVACGVTCSRLLK